MDLGRLEKIDLRKAWKSEGSDFTPWLATEKNLTLLGDTIGIELELEAQEQNIGPFRADILCRDTTDGHWVLIENQLEKTDHTHLGQLITYAAGLKAVTIVWIAQRFTDEHRAAIDWLNEVTGEGFNFFGLEVELWKIGDSPIAPKFNMVSKPNDWSKSVSGSSKRFDSQEMTDRRRMQYDFWAGFKEYLIEENSFLKSKKPRPKSGYTFAVGRAKFRIVARVLFKDNLLSCDLLVEGPEAKPHFHLLQGQKQEIEKELGLQLEWEEKKNTMKSIVRLVRSVEDAIDKDKWNDYYLWLREWVEKFHTAFGNRIKALDATEYNNQQANNHDEPDEVG